MPQRALRVTLGTLARLTHADGRGKGLLTGVFRKSCFRVVRTGFDLHGQDPLRTVVDLSASRQFCTSDPIFIEPYGHALCGGVSWR